MKTRFTILAIASTLAAAPLFAQTASTLPANVQSDIAALKQDAANVRAAQSQLRTDEESSSPATAADRTAVAMARVQLKMDASRLHVDAQPIVQADESALLAALTQLRTDQLANNTAAVATDHSTVQAAQLALDTDMRALGADRHFHGGKGRR